MNKTAASSDLAFESAPASVRLFDNLGVRLLLLLMLAEIPLVVYTVAVSLQNDRLRASDALSRANILQRDALDERNHDLRIGASLALASATLPTAMFADAGACRTVLHTLIAPDTDRVAEAFAINADESIRCRSEAGPSPTASGWVQALLTSDSKIGLAMSGGWVYVSHRLAPSAGGPAAIAIRLAADHSVLADMQHSDPAGRVPRPCLWLRRKDGWLALDDAPFGEIAANPARLDKIGRQPIQMQSRDGRDFLYSAMPLNATFGEPGASLVASSDIRIAEMWSARVFVERILEMMLFFACEFMLIALGVGQVVTRPLLQLHDAVRTWRKAGTFDARGLQHDPRELRELTASFAQAAQSLDQRERELRFSITQQDLLMKEIHHRVKNNLQIVASLLNLQASRIKAPEARAEFQSARDRVRALATLHRHLYADGELHMIDMRAFFVELCSQLFQALGEAEGDRIGLVVSAPDIHISSDQAVPIALIVTETVGNAIKYAFPGDRRGMIEVTMHVEPDDAGTLIVKDDGVGLADPGEGGAKRGLGMQLVRGFARQLGAKLVVTHDRGTCYHVSLKLERQRSYDTAKLAAQPADVG